MNNYAELLKKHQDASNAFPMVFLFGPKIDKKCIVRKEVDYE